MRAAKCDRCGDITHVNDCTKAGRHIGEYCARCFDRIDHDELARNFAASKPTGNDNNPSLDNAIRAVMHPGDELINETTCEQALLVVEIGDRLCRLYWLSLPSVPAEVVLMVRAAAECGHEDCGRLITAHEQKEKRCVSPVQSTARN